MSRIVILRWGHRLQRDARLTTHILLTARALGASGLILSDTKDEKLKETYKIYILRDMPTFHFIATAAHELMHVWQRLNGSDRNRLITVEGSCNYASYLVLSTYEDKRAKYIIESLKQDDNPIYGDGFRLIKEFVEKNELPAWLNALRRGELN